MLELAAHVGGILRGPGRYRLVVVDVAFADAPSVTREGWAPRTAAEMDAYFREASGGVLRWSLAGMRSLVLRKPSRSFHLTRRLLRDRIEFWQRLTAGLGALDESDAVLAVVPDAAAIRGCFAVGPRWNSPRLNTALASLGEPLPRGAVVRASSSWGTIAHELGHVLGLPDLYDYRVGRRSASYAASHFVGPWDLMGRVPDDMAGARPHPMAWTRTLAGWITPAHAAGGRSEFALGEDGAAALRIPVTDTSGVFVEARIRAGFDAVLPGEGVLVSVADEAVPEGRGPLRIARGGSAGSDWDVALRPGGRLSVQGVAVHVIERTASGYRVEIDGPRTERPSGE